MILGLPEEIFFILIYSSAATIAAVVFGILLYLVPPIGKLLLKNRLARVKRAVVFEMQKASLVPFLAESFGPGWVKTSEGKKYVMPIPPKTGSDWNPERDVLGKLCLLDGNPCFITYETSILAGNPEIFAGLEAFVKGYSEEKHIQISSNPELKVSIPVTPRVLAEAIQGPLSAELDQFEERVIETEVKRRAKSEWGPVIKIAVVLGMIFIAGLVTLFIAKGELGL